MKAKNITGAILFIGIITIVLGLIRGNNLYRQDTITTTKNVGTNTKLDIEQTNDLECIIIVNGNKYNVTELRDNHEGGDVFRCDEDMTEIFKKAHGGYLKMIEKFKVQ
jgi:cytochrome b involved in lipid metabolism